jgi:protein transport protein SEC31
MNGLVSNAIAQIFKLDYADPSTNMPLAGGAVHTSERFHRLAWGTAGAKTDLSVSEKNL